MAKRISPWVKLKVVVVPAGATVLKNALVKSARVVLSEQSPAAHLIRYYA